MANETALDRARSKEAIFDQRTSLVKEFVSKQNAALDERTVKLRALRLEKQISAAQPSIQPPVQKPAMK